MRLTAREWKCAVLEHLFWIWIARKEPLFQCQNVAEESSPVFLKVRRPYCLARNRPGCRLEFHWETSQRRKGSMSELLIWPLTGFDHDEEGRSCFCWWWDELPEEWGHNLRLFPRGSWQLFDTNRPICIIKAQESLKIGSFQSWWPLLPALANQSRVKWDMEIYYPASGKETNNTISSQYRALNGEVLLRKQAFLSFGNYWPKSSSSSGIFVSAPKSFWANFTSPEEFRT